jgi:hypothetical protein
MTTFALDRIKGVYGLAPATLTSATETFAPTGAGNGIDTTGFRSLLIIVKNSASSTNTLTLKLYDGATSTTATTAVAFETSPTAINCTAVGQTVFQVDLSGMNKYVQASITPLNTTSVVFDVDFVLADARIDPATGTAVVPLRKAL